MPNQQASSTKPLQRADWILDRTKNLRSKSRTSQAWILKESLQPKTEHKRTI
ncbi:MAG: hypothetical protein L6R41_004808 [Letrouitia leprolyta]|nr:MAG: hypothetical protein L6R41_004808 [Letrouitia leprolyta]